MRSLIFLTLLALAGVCSVSAQNTAGTDSVEMARRKFQEGKLDPAMAILNEAEKRDALSGRGLDTRGCILLEQGKIEDALKCFEAATEKDAWIYAPLHRGDALVRQKNWEEARLAYQAGSKETNVLLMNERYRFGIFVTYLGAKDEEAARKAFEQISFPTVTAAYYYAQAAWDFAHGKNRDGQNWTKRAEEVFSPRATSWFARHLFEFGWLKSKPPLLAD